MQSIVGEWTYLTRLAYAVRAMSREFIARSSNELGEFVSWFNFGDGIAVEP